MPCGNKGEDLTLISRTILETDMATCTYNPGIGEVETDGFLPGTSWPVRLSISTSPTSARDLVLKNKVYNN